MDEVFGNSSTETVVSVQDLENQSSNKDQDCTESSSFPTTGNEDNTTDIASSNKVINDESLTVQDLPQQQDDVKVIRDSVIKCLSTTKQGDSEGVFKVPFLPPPPSGSLRHTQSAVVQGSSVLCPRIRAHSTSETIQTKHHPYQNIPINASSYSIKLPSYVNLPKNTVENAGRVSMSSFGELNSTKSAPSTPRGTRSHDTSRVNNSYIQLWTGAREELASVDHDTTETSSLTGYVSMTSPYIRSPNSSIISDLAYQLSTFGGTRKSSDVFCPFCPRPFTQEQYLKHHIQAIHRHELQKVVCSHEPVLIQYCPRCPSRFFNLYLLPSHLLEFHRETVIDILDDCGAIKVNDKEVKCPFCLKKIYTSTLREENLLYHIVQLHSVEYECLIRSLFKPIECFKKSEELRKMSAVDLARALSFQPGATSTPGLSLKFKGLSCETEIPLNVSHTSLEETWNSHSGMRADKMEGSKGTLNQVASKGILRSQTDLSRKPSVKRELRFSVPPVTSEEFFIPESPETNPARHIEELIERNENYYPGLRRREIPIRVDSLSSADFIELNNLPSRKRRRLGVGLKSKKSFKKKKNETNQLLDNVFEGLKNIGCGKPSNECIVATTATRSFRKPKPVAPPKVPSFQMTDRTSKVPPPPSEIRMTVEESNNELLPSEYMQPSPFGNMKLYSPLKMFRCNGCRIKFCDNESLGAHIRAKHRGLMGMIKPHFACGVCSAKFYENKYLVKHCLQHHTSLLEIRSPKTQKISIYRFNQD